MIRVVRDTNILISALLQTQGLAAHTFLTTLAGTTAQSFVSGVVYAEYEEVEAVAADITGRGGVAEAEQVDARDEQTVEK